MLDAVNILKPALARGALQVIRDKPSQFPLGQGGILEIHTGKDTNAHSTWLYHCGMLVASTALTTLPSIHTTIHLLKQFNQHSMSSSISSLRIR
jgi:hypothetical protein